MKGLLQRTRIDPARLWPRSPAPWLALLVAVATFGLLLAVDRRGLPTDLPNHVRFVMESQVSGDWLPNWVFYRSISLAATRSGDPLVLTLAALVLLSVAAAAKYAITVRMLREPLRERITDATPVERHAALGITAVAALVLQLAFALPSGGWNANLYLGQFPANIWHNSTTIAVMPFVLLLVAVSMRYLREPTAAGAAAIAALGVLNVLVKPSFFMSYVFVYPVFVLAFHRLRRPTWLAVLPVAAPGLLMWWQANSLFGAHATSVHHVGTVKVDPMFVWHMYSTHPVRSVLVSIAFPLAVTLLRPRTAVRSPFLWFAWANLAVALAEFVLLAETGRRALDGNFSWQVIIATYLLFTAATVEVLRRWFAREQGESFVDVVDWVLIALLLAHACSGALFLVRWFLTGSYF